MTKNYSIAHRRRMLGMGLLALCGVGVGLVAWYPGPTGDTNPVLQAGNMGATTQPDRPAGLRTASGPPAVMSLDYDKLNPADFVLTAASFGGNASYGQAMLLESCDIHHKTRHELDGEEARRAALQVDPSGQHLKQLEFDRKVADEECKGFSEQDPGKVADLMAAAAAQGDPHASAWVMDRRYAQINSELEALDDDSPERAGKLAEVQALLPKALALAEQGEGKAALLASAVLATDAYGKKDLEEAARWLLVATQISGTEFRINPMIFQNEPYDSLSQQQIAQASEQALKVMQRCCDTHVVEMAGVNPF